MDGAKDFVSALEGLRARGGGDCPELAMQGILNALELVDQFSAIFVFTDASAKDSYRKSEVIDKAMSKWTSISFFGKQDCGSPAAHSTYNEIAEVLGGHVVRSISKDTSLVDMVKSLTEYSGSDVGGTSSTGGDGKRSAGDSKVVRIAVDSTVTQMKIVVTTYSLLALSMSVDGPYSKNKSEISVGRNYGNFHLGNPPSGYYTLTYSPDDCKYTVYLESTLHFRYSFWADDESSDNVYLLDSPVKGKYSSKSVSKLVLICIICAGTRTHILVQILQGSKQISKRCSHQIQFLDTRTGGVISSHTLTEAGSTISLTAHVTIPTRSFRVQFVACDMTGIEVIRQKQLPVTPSDHAVQLVLVGSHTISTGVVRSTFSISNFGKISSRYSLQVPTPPPGTSASVSPSAIAVKPAATGQFHVTFTVSSSAKVSPEFTVQASVGGTTEVAAKYKYKYIEDARLASVLCTVGTFTVRPGSSSSGYCYVRNLGPGRGRFSFTVSSGPPGFSAAASPSAFDLAENGEARISVTVSAPKSATSDTAAVFELTTMSGRLEVGSDDITFRIQVSQ